MCYTAAPASAVLSLHRYPLLTPFPRLFPSLPHICDARPQTWRPRSHPHSLLSFTLATSLSCAHPLAPLAIGDSPRPASSEPQGESESFARPSAQAPECAAPSRQRVSHVTASQGRSAWSLTSVYFPPFSPNMESSRNKKGPFPHYGEGRGNFKSGL